MDAWPPELRENKWLLFSATQSAVPRSSSRGKLTHSALDCDWHEQMRPSPRTQPGLFLPLLPSTHLLRSSPSHQTSRRGETPLLATPSFVPYSFGHERDWRKAGELREDPVWVKGHLRQLAADDTVQNDRLRQCGRTRLPKGAALRFRPKSYLLPHMRSFLRVSSKFLLSPSLSLSATHTHPLETLLSEGLLETIQAHNRQQFTLLTPYCNSAVDNIRRVCQ